MPQTHQFPRFFLLNGGGGGCYHNGFVLTVTEEEKERKKFQSISLSIEWMLFFFLLFVNCTQTLMVLYTHIVYKPIYDDFSGKTQFSFAIDELNGMEWKHWTDIIQCIDR